MILLAYQNIKIFLQKAMFQKILTIFLWLRSLKHCFKGKEIIGTLYENELQKKKIKKIRIAKLITKKDDKLCIEWKGYNNFNISIDKKVIV